MSLAQSNTRGGPQAFEAQQRRLDFASVKQACPKGIYLTPTPRDPHIWQGVLFVRKGPYTPAILKFSLLLAADKPPTITFSTDIFHPLVTPLTTYTYTTSDTGADTVHATDDERLPPGGFSLRHGFPQWFGRKKPKPTSQVGLGEETASVSERSQSSYGPLAIVQILFYMRSAFDTAEVLDKVPLEAAGNPGAWHAWQTHRARVIGTAPRSATPEDGKTPASPTSRQQPGGARRPGQWNWEGVWEERVKKGVQASVSQQTLFGTACSNDDLINFLNIDTDATDIPWHMEQEAGDNLNTDSKTLQATQNSKSKTSSSTAYGHTPGALGLHSWHPPQAHMFVSSPASMGSFSTITHPTRANTSPTNAPSQNRPTVGSPETRLSNRTSGSPLKVRKTRENLRTGFIDDAASTSGHPVNGSAHNKHHPAQPLREIQNTVHDEITRPSSRNNRFSWESDTLHLTTVIERSPTKRTSSQSENTESKSAPSLSRKLSVRKRVVSRVREGLLSRSKSSSKVPVRVDDVAISRSASEHERFAQITLRDPSQVMEEGTVASHNLASGSVQSFVSTDSLLGDTGLTIDILPGPNVDSKSVLPGSDGSHPSPSQEAKPSPSPSPEKTPRPRRFAQSSQTHFETEPKPLLMLHVNLSIKPAWETLDVADDATMWAMIKAEASLSSDPLPTEVMSDIRRSASPEHIAKIQKPLNIIVIIDNSSFASPLALQSISEFTRVLYILLSRIAMLGYQVRLSAPCSAKTGCVVTLEPSGKARLWQGNATVFGCKVVQIGYVYEPPSPREQVTIGGWCFEWEAAHDAVLQALIQSAREISHLQELSHVKVSVNSTEPCRVEKLLTPPRKATLHPGQCTTLFAKVRIPSVDRQRNADPASVEGLLSELHQTLGIGRSELFKADVRYKHSLLPRDTELRTEQACELIRTNRNSQWGAIHDEEDKYGVDIEMEKAKFAARNYPPDVAIRILHKKFGKFWSGNDGPPDLHRLREELEFQKRVWAEMPKGVVQSSTAATQRQDSKSARRTMLHLADTEALQVFNTAPSTPTPDEGDPNIKLPVAEHHSDHGQRLDSLVIQDEARRIWRHMRRNSRTTSGVLSASDASSRACSGAPQQEQQLQRRGSQESIVDRMAAADTRINEIRLKAIQNKRSVGAETLREFSMMHQKDDGGPNDLRDEACMPWL
ncbi:hypothetical protein KCU95_g7952, partial [Aureobasidium melanogenum]